MTLTQIQRYKRRAKATSYPTNCIENLGKKKINGKIDIIIAICFKRKKGIVSQTKDTEVKAKATS